jgi:hypothetical protein
MQTGTFDAAKQAFIYEWTDELIPGQAKKNSRIITIIDSNHYKEGFYEIENKKFVKVRGADYTKTKVVADMRRRLIQPCTKADYGILETTIYVFADV